MDWQKNMRVDVPPNFAEHWKSFGCSGRMQSNPKVLANWTGQQKISLEILKLQYLETNSFVDEDAYLRFLFTPRDFATLLVNINAKFYTILYLHY